MVHKYVKWKSKSNLGTAKMNENTKFIPMRAKRVGEFIKNGHKKIIPTHIGSGSGVTLSLCDSVTL
jgi:hypothetical protein